MNILLLVCGFLLFFQLREGHSTASLKEPHTASQIVCERRVAKIWRKDRLHPQPQGPRLAEKKKLSDTLRNVCKNASVADLDTYSKISKALYNFEVFLWRDEQIRSEITTHIDLKDELLSLQPWRVPQNIKQKLADFAVQLEKYKETKINDIPPKNYTETCQHIKDWHETYYCANLVVNEAATTELAPFKLFPNLLTKTKHLPDQSLKLSKLRDILEPSPYFVPKQRTNASAPAIYKPVGKPKTTIVPTPKSLAKCNVRSSPRNISWTNFEEPLNQLHTNSTVVEVILKTLAAPDQLICKIANEALNIPISNLHVQPITQVPTLSISPASSVEQIKETLKKTFEKWKDPSLSVKIIKKLLVISNKKAAKILQIFKATTPWLSFEKSLRKYRTNAKHFDVIITILASPDYIIYKLAEDGLNIPTKNVPIDPILEIPPITVPLTKSNRRLKNAITSTFANSNDPSLKIQIIKKLLVSSKRKIAKCLRIMNTS